MSFKPISLRDWAKQYVPPEPEDTASAMVPACCKAAYLNLDVLSTNPPELLDPFLAEAVRVQRLDLGLLVMSCATRKGKALRRRLEKEWKGIDRQWFCCTPGFYIVYDPQHLVSRKLPVTGRGPLSEVVRIWSKQNKGFRAW